MARNREKTPSGGGTPATQARGAQQPAAALAGQVPDIVGIEQDELESNPDEVYDETLKRAQFGNLSIPSAAVAGDTLTIAGRVWMDLLPFSPTCLGTRIRVEAPHLSEPIIRNVGSLCQKEDANFTIDVPVPDTPGQTIAITVKAQSDRFVTGWETDDKVGPKRIDVKTEGQVTQGRLLDYAPYVLGGAGFGVAVSRFVGDGNTRAGVGAGAAAGVGAKVLADNYSGFDIQFPTWQIAAVGAASLGVAALLRTSGADAVLGSLGNVASTAVDTGRKAVESGRQAAGEITSGDSGRSRRDPPALPPANGD